MVGWLFGWLIFVCLFVVNGNRQERGGRFSCVQLNNKAAHLTPPAHRMCEIDGVEKAILGDKVTEGVVPRVFSGKHRSVFKTNKCV